MTSPADPEVCHSSSVPLLLLYGSTWLMMRNRALRKWCLLWQYVLLWPLFR
jgi:hypothetical protein